MSLNAPSIVESEHVGSWRRVNKETRKEMGDAIRKHVWHMFFRHRGRPIIIKDVVSSVREMLTKIFSDCYRDCKPSREYIEKEMYEIGSNIASFSNGAEVYVCRSNQMTYMEEYQEYFQPMYGPGKALAIRRAIRDELMAVQKVGVKIVKARVRQDGLSFRFSAVTTRSGLFSIKPEKDETYISTRNRINVKGGK